MKRQFDLAIIGGGPAGYLAAALAAQAGRSVALIEEQALGGTCLNVGCIPAKALLESSELYAKLPSYQNHGLVLPIGETGIDLDKMLVHKEQIITKLQEGIVQLLDNSQVTVINGHGSIDSDLMIAVTTKDETISIQATDVILAVGSKPFELPLAPFGEDIISSTEALNLTAIPNRLAIIGGGAIGLEMGSVWARLGSKVTIFEMMPQIGGPADKQLSQTLERLLKKQGLDIKTKSQVLKVEKNNNELAVTFSRQGSEETLCCDKLLVAVGRIPNTESLRSSLPNLVCDKRGFIQVNNEFATNIPHLWAIGDCTPGPMLAHKAEDDARSLINHLLGKEPFKRSAIPTVIYTSPELAQVGLTEQQAKEMDLPVKCGKSYFAANGRAQSLDEADGLVKVVVNKDNMRILGVHILGPHASELLGEAQLALTCGLTANDVYTICHAHPTLAEAIREACHNCGESI